MPRNIDLSVYLVLDPILCQQKGMVQTALEAVENGVTVVQLRAPDWKKKAWYECAVQLKKALAGKALLIINDQIDVALAVDADGVHIGQKDLPVEVVRQLIGPEKILGLSASYAHEVTQANAQAVDYLGIGPIFQTQTKLDADPAIAIDGFARLRALTKLPCVAIGSVKAEHARALKQAKADGLAVVSAICGQDDVALAARTLRHAWDLASDTTTR